MIDPMADLTAQSSGQQNGTNEKDETCDMHAMMYNISKMDKIRSFMGIISGCCSGILGLTNLMGLIFFIACHLVVNGMIFLQIKCDLEKYRGKRCTLIGFVMEGFQNCAMSFMLFWTLFYGLVYLF
mmetsp:Transcript_25463/g.31371  ORF Transcript_25463/g.31371 Transcript_25463/m.31371 type:complete len:126 (+) Transcript_25463:101-478(+)